MHCVCVPVCVRICFLCIYSLDTNLKPYYYIKKDMPKERSCYCHFKCKCVVSVNCYSKPD